MIYSREQGEVSMNNQDDKTSTSAYCFLDLPISDSSKCLRSMPSLMHTYARVMVKYGYDTKRETAGITLNLYTCPPLCAHSPPARLPNLPCCHRIQIFVDPFKFGRGSVGKRRKEKGSSYSIHTHLMCVRQSRR